MEEQTQRAIKAEGGMTLALEAGMALKQSIFAYTRVANLCSSSSHTSHVLCGFGESCPLEELSNAT